jgi:hypothetical protein
VAPSSLVLSDALIDPASLVVAALMLIAGVVPPLLTIGAVPDTDVTPEPPPVASASLTQLVPLYFTTCPVVGEVMTTSDNPSSVPLPPDGVTSDPSSRMNFVPSGVPVANRAMLKTPVVT